MWVYKVWFFTDENLDGDTDEGIVAGEEISDAYKNLKNYYGDNIEELHIYKMESAENVLSFIDCECGLGVKDFVKEEKEND